jgi:sugar O-acyltransferase (sialic acid O-acetyltransferase NeuD family)
MRRVLILGAGRGGQIVADILLLRHAQDGSDQPIGFLDDDSRLVGTSVMGLPVFGALAQLQQFEHDAVIVAVGDNRARARIQSMLDGQGEHTINAVHPSVVASLGVQIGRGVVLSAGVVLSTAVYLSDGVIVSAGSVVSHHVQVGSHARIGPGVAIAGGASIGQGALIGVGARILPDISIGDWAIVGGGAVVTRDVPTATTVAGIPARPLNEPAH